MNRSSLVSTDPIADMLSRVRNAVAVNKSEVSMPHSKLKQTIAQILVDNGFLAGVNIDESSGYKNLVIKVNNEDEAAKITAVSRLSRPGRRLYVKSPAIPTVKRGRGIVIISTSRGIM